MTEPVPNARWPRRLAALAAGGALAVLVGAGLLATRHWTAGSAATVAGLYAALLAETLRQGRAATARGAAARAAGRAALALGVTYGLICAGLWLLQDRLVYFPERTLAQTPAAAGLAYEDVWLTAEDGVRLHAWYVPARRQRGTVLFCHGNAGNLGNRVATMAIHWRLGLASLHVDYRGYGQSGGTPSEAGLVRDAEAAWRYLVEERGVAPEALVVHGRSLGGAVAAALAQRHPPRALILESTFTSLRDEAAAVMPLVPARHLVRDEYDTLGRIGGITCPKLHIHSRQDKLVPWRLGRRLYEAAPPPKVWMTIRGSHADGYVETGTAYLKGLDAFLQIVLAGDAPGDERDGER